MPFNYKSIEEWSEESLLVIPKEESDVYEYKSSKVPIEKLKEKISIAASAFWNSGGGIFIAGVNDEGKIDGGIPDSIGRQKLRDWVDQVISSVEPAGPYTVHTIYAENDESLIEKGKTVLVVSFGDSEEAPHMAPDKKYYIRAGAHSGPASHFLVEAIRSRRGLMRPLLRGVLKNDDRKPDVEQLVILALNNAVALDVTIDLKPLPKAFTDHFESDFPLEISAIDKNNPFSFDISVFGIRSQIFGEEPITLHLSYKDVAGRVFKDQQIVDPNKNVGPMKIGTDVFKQINKSVEKLTKEISRLSKNMG